MIDLTPSEDAIDGVINDPNQPVVQGRRDLLVPALYRQDQSFVVQGLGLGSNARHDQAQRGFAG